MSIYKGNTLLTGGGSGGGSGGGGTSVGGFSFFITPTGTTFTSGQEVYTDPDGAVWLRSGAILTDAGTGILDAAQYRDSQGAVRITDPVVSTGGANARSDRSSVAYDGRNLVVVGFNEASGGGFAVQLFNPTTGVSVSEVNSASAFGGAFAAYTDTHTFLSGPTLGANTANWANSTLYYVPTSQLTDTTAYINAYSGTGSTAYTAPNAGASFAVTNPGLANERFWQVNAPGGSVLNEYTFDNTAAAGTNPFTATGNSITLPVGQTGGAVNLITLAADNNVLYVHTTDGSGFGGSLLEYNATTRVLLRDLTGVPTARGTVQRRTVGGQTFALVPNSRTSNSERSLWFNTNPANSGGRTQVNVTRYREQERLIAVYDGDSTYNPSTESGTRIPITLGDVSGGNSVAAHYGGSAGDLIYLWQRIA